ncbi:MAG: response regulator transcription factor [Gammaproteobacteria bacterium]|jgi:two-component system, NarL family, nitrate/nitrite response regulator NarL|nr:response regulator transcription factor [Gammaproteobacteria bacterium]MBU0771626.1 response regulator transcription factor [Gammaproteobacteria bacterium]MBU0856899.1 response regulator transcription factor [Gammaproteobacteria bacterium]MBU1848200.1 response regulator transcription factor [Gammaproteobacteria bacterium]
MRILIADDHPLFRDALARMVQELNPDAHIAEAGSAAELEQLLERDPSCELMLIDLRMPGSKPSQTVERLHARHPAVPIVVVSGSENPLDAEESLARGALFYLRKSLTPEAIRRHLSTLLSGELPDARDDPAMWPVERADGPRLTPRQLEVLRALSGGASNKLIARELGLSEGTVKLHVAAVIGALAVQNRTEAAARARELGLA